MESAGEGGVSDRQIEILRRAGDAGRLALALGWSAEMMALSRAALRRADPTADAVTLQCRFVRVSYGEGLAVAYGRRLAAAAALGSATHERLPAR